MRTVLIALSFLAFFSCNSSSSTQKELLIVDVRTVEEWEQDGHAECSVNYPLDQFESKIDDLKEYNNVILVCRSGNRAEQAKLILQNAGYQHAENKGAWQNIECK